ncbi:exported hypothetical protein [Verrucomicrobia bacterium]|nr:exported hypothetical protein [Verrucomicrobiota bacterium]
MKPKSLATINRLIPLAAALTLAQAVRGTDVYTPVPLTPGSFNADMVVEKTAVPPIENYINACLDGGTNLTGNTWFEQGYYPGVGGGGQLAWGLPPHGSTFEAQYLPDGTLGPDTNFVYSMAPDYTTNNALFISLNNGPSAAQLTITNPTPFLGLSVLNASGNGGETIGYQVQHQDGSVETGTFVSADWWHGNGSAPYPAWMAFCLISVDGGNLQQQGGNNGDLYHNEITLTNTTSPVVGIGFTNMGGGGGGRMGVFGISGSTDGVSFTNPLALTGFNADLIIETNARNWSANVAYCTATMERGTNLWGAVYMERGFGGQNPAYGLPPAGSTVTNAGGDHAFVLAPSYTAANMMAVCSNGWGPPGGTFTLSSPAAYNVISLVGGATWGPKYVDITVHHGASSETISAVSIPDWFNSSGTLTPAQNNGFAATLGLATGAGFQTDNSSFHVGNVSQYRLFAVDVPLGDTTDPVTSVDLVYNQTVNVGNSPSGVIFIASLCGSNNAAATPGFQPVPVTGYNEDMVIEKSAVLHPLGLYNATTASMDGGTNNTGNTWYEQGFYKQFPTTGLPAAGSTLHSIAQPASYQMPASYTANNAVYVDATHTNANLTPTAPAIYTALSVLSSDANGQVTNLFIVQHDDGTQESATLVSRDWFNNTPYAFTSLGRVNLDTPAINNDPGHTGTPNPRLYEAQFGLTNNVSPVTNIVLQYSGAQNTTSGRTALFAVSGATGSYPVIFRSASQNTNTAIEGVTLIFSATTAGGATPIAYNWQVQAGTNWVNLTDGQAGVSGSETLTCTIATYPGWMTNAGSPINGTCSFRLQASNAAAIVYAPTLNVNLFSGYPDLPAPGDPVTTFGAGTGDAGPQGNIDDLVGGNPDVKCLWFAAANCGFSTIPSVGSSIAQAIRLYWGNDSDGRDPATVILDGSNDGGTTWVNILPQTGITHNTARNSAASVAPNPLTQAVQEFNFYSNTTAYTSYRVTFPTVFNASSGGNLTQIGEVEILGQSLNTAPPAFTVQPPAAETVYMGSSPTFSVAASGAPILHYQWFSNNVQIAKATNTSFTLVNAQLANSGNTFYCNVKNANGNLNSSTVTLTVIPLPSQPYPLAVLNDHPMAFYQLNEADDNLTDGNDGKLCNDYVGGFFGIYSNAVLSQPGYNTNLDTNTAALFGSFATSDSMAYNIPISFGVAAGQSAAFSIEAWVQGASGTLQGHDAGLVTIGYGGFEQFNLDTGGNDPTHDFRFYVRDATGNTHGPNGTKTPDDGLWHHVVGVCDEAHSNVVLYIDGIQNAITEGAINGLGILAPTTPLSIGSRRSSTVSGYDDQFIGTIDDVALYNYALSPSQVLAHYYAAEKPPVFSLQPSNTTANENTTAVIDSSAYGPGTLGYQWYQSSDLVTWTAVSGQTSNNLVLPNVSGAAPPTGQNGESYEVVVTNNYGATTSAVALLTVNSGPPSFVVNLPATQLAIAGSTLTLAVEAGGSAPFTYQWTHAGTNLIDNGRISGSQGTALMIGDLTLSDAGAYQVGVLNAQAGGIPVLSQSDALTVLPDLGFGGDGQGWQLQGTGQQKIVNNVLTVSDNGQSENASAYFTNQVYVGSPFVASFTYQVVGGLPGAEADGTCFVLQDDPRGPSVLSGGGGSFGISGVAPSAEFEINLYTGVPANLGGEGIAFNINGNLGNVNGQPNLPTAPVVLDTGDHIEVKLVYVNNIVTATLTEVETHATFSTSFNLNLLGTDIPSLLGSDWAYAGFSGATGGVSSYQQVSDFAFASLPELSVRKSGNSVILSWPQVTGNFILQSETDPTSGTWANVNAPVDVVGGQNQVTVRESTSAQFYRLALELH